MLIAPDGSILQMEAMLPYFSVLPFSDILFQDYTFSGIALLLVNGIPNLIASYLLLKKKKKGVVLGGILGVTLMLWITIQFIIFPFNALSTSYFIFGFLQAITGYAAYVFLSQETMDVKKSDYPGIGKRGEDLVVYFSRLGYTRRLAFEEAARMGAEVEEIKAKEKTGGTGGFWWCGRFGMHGWAMDIEDMKSKCEDYRSVTVCTPTWVFGPSAPIRKYLELNKGKIKELRIVINHFQPCAMKCVAREMEKIAGMKAVEIISISSRLGKVRGEYRIS